MDKKARIVIIGIIVILVLVAGIVYFKIKRGSFSLISPLTQETETEAPELATWEDPAGFSFSYPKEIEIDPHEEDTENYAHLELASLGRSGNIQVWVKETDYSEIEDWIEEEVGEQEQVFDTELDGEPAKKVAYTDPERLVVVAIDVDALVLIEMTPDEEGYWQEIYNRILSSFIFIPLEGEEGVAPESGGEGGGGSGIIYETEEVIE